MEIPVVLKNKNLIFQSFFLWSTFPIPLRFSSLAITTITLQEHANDLPIIILNLNFIFIYFRRKHSGDRGFGATIPHRLEWRPSRAHNFFIVPSVDAPVVPPGRRHDPRFDHIPCPPRSQCSFPEPDHSEVALRFLFQGRHLLYPDKKADGRCQ